MLPTWPFFFWKNASNFKIKIGLCKLLLIFPLLSFSVLLLSDVMGRLARRIPDLNTVDHCDFRPHSYWTLKQGVLLAKTVQLRDSPWIWQEKTVGISLTIQKKSPLTCNQSVQFYVVWTQWTTWSNDGAELWAFKKVRNFSKAYRSDVGSSNLMKNLLMYQMRQKLLREESKPNEIGNEIPLAESWSVRDAMKARVEKQTKADTW